MISDTKEVILGHGFVRAVQEHPFCKVVDKHRRARYGRGCLCNFKQFHPIPGINVLRLVSGDSNGPGHFFQPVIRRPALSVGDAPFNARGHVPVGVIGVAVACAHAGRGAGVARPANFVKVRNSTELIVHYFFPAWVTEPVQPGLTMFGLNA